MRAWCLAVVLVSMLAAGSSAAPPEGRVERLARGINVSHWFWIPTSDSPQARTRYLSASDVAALKAAGFTHARVPVEPGWLWDEGADALRADRLAEYRRGIELFTSRAMAVVVDVHPARTPWLARLDDAAVAEFERFWKAFAAALADTDPEFVLLEIMNEPHDLPDPATWNAAQARLVGAVRAAAPRHTLVCTGDSWGSIDGLLRCRPVSDDNVVYSFHFYEPHNFTHQGATWGFDAWRDLANVPYPATPESLRAAGEALSSKRAREVLAWSATRDPWSAGAIRKRIEVAAAWGKEHSAALYCGEFGVHRPKAPADARGRWLSDVVSALESQKIGWAMWDYAGGFALAVGGPGERVLDPGTAGALIPAKK